LKQGSSHDQRIIGLTQCHGDSWIGVPRAIIKKQERQDANYKVGHCMDQGSFADNRKEGKNFHGMNAHQTLITNTAPQQSPSAHAMEYSG